MKQKPDDVLTTRVPAELKKRLKWIARAEQRTLSNMVEIFLTKAVEKWEGVTQ